MPYFRTPGCETTHPARAGSAGLSLEAVRRLVAEAMRPAHFFVAGGGAWEWRHLPGEEVCWEIYQGRLLDAAQTRARQAFETWGLFAGAGGLSEPVMAVRLDAANRQLHVTRAIYCYAWEGYHAGDNIFLSRETRRWVRELVGTISLDRFAAPAALRDELSGLLFAAVVGTSRLPLLSVEAPLPAFSLGELAYVYRPSDEGRQAGDFPMRSPQELIAQGLGPHLSWREKAKLLEAVLRALPAEQVAEAAEAFRARWRALGHADHELAALLRTLFNEVALSPYTAFVDQALAFLKAWVRAGHLEVAVAADFLSYLLRQTARHLTAYDLITFHHRGANYPDALLLDAALRAYLGLSESHPELFTPAAADDAPGRRRKRIRRRALRQGWLLWHACQGLPVPDEPTSPGENARVLPPPHRRLPEEQILDPAKRGKRLFAGQTLGPQGARGQAILRQSLTDLEHPEELQELGMALFLDRPLGVCKPPGLPDQTLLLSYEAFSRRLAERRLRYLAENLELIRDAQERQRYRETLLSLPVLGLPLRPTGRRPRPGAVSLDDALKVAEDFVLLRTTRQTAQAFLRQFDFAPLARRLPADYLEPGQGLVVVAAASVGRAAEDVLAVYDGALRRRLELQIDPSQGYQTRAGQEYPTAGLRVPRAWGPVGSGGPVPEHELGDQPITILPRD